MRRVAWLDFGNGGSSKGRRLWQILLVATVLLRPVQASDQVIVTSSPPSDALARFFASQRQPRPRVEAMLEVSASLPKLNKSGRLAAIRRIPPEGQATYQIVHIDGDSVVKREILARYLVADSQARALSPAATAITPANYRFLYAGAVELPNHLAYAFRIISRKKRVGLLNGVIWVDAGTGSAVRISGHFVKTPSILIKRIEITRQNALDDIDCNTTVTHLSVETRISGPARLKIVEHAVCGEDARSFSTPTDPINPDQTPQPR